MHDTFFRRTINDQVMGNLKYASAFFLVAAALAFQRFDASFEDPRCWAFAICAGLAPIWGSHAFYLASDMTRHELWRELEAAARRERVAAVDLEEDVVAELGDAATAFDLRTTGGQQIKFTAQYMLVQTGHSWHFCSLRNMMQRRHTHTTDHYNNGRYVRSTTRYWLKVEYGDDMDREFNLHVDSREALDRLDREIKWRRELVGVRFSREPSSPGARRPASPGGRRASSPGPGARAPPRRPPTRSSTTASLYGVLGVAPTASRLEIRRAYMSLALRHHPDKNPGDASAAERFRAVNSAYEVLYNESSRRAYDAASGFAE